MQISHLRLAIFLCVAMAVLVAAMPPALGLVFTFLIPFWFFLAYAVIALLSCVLCVRKALLFPTLPVLSPRPPPVR